MARLDENETSFLTERAVLAQMGASHPGSRAVSPVFVFEHPFEDQNFLPSIMAMGLKMRSRSPAHECRVPGPGPEKGHDRQPFDQTRKPGSVAGRDDRLRGITFLQVARLQKRVHPASDENVTGAVVRRVT